MQTKATFMNIVKVTEVKDIDYIFHFFNSYSGESTVFKVYKELFDKAMEIRKIQELEVTVTSDKEEEKKKEEEKIAKVYI